MNTDEPAWRAHPQITMRWHLVVIGRTGRPTDGNLIFSAKGQSPSRFSPDGRYLAVAQISPGTDIWDLTTHSLIHHLEQSAPVTEIAFSREAPYLATGDAESIRVWSMLAWNELALFAGGVASYRNSSNLKITDEGNT